MARKKAKTRADYDISPELIVEVTRTYAVLITALKELKEIKGDKNEAVSGYVADRYGEASRACAFLTSKTVPSDLQEKLNIGELEKELSDYANTHIRL